MTRRLPSANSPKKGVEAGPVIEKIISLDDRRKAIQAELDSTLAAQNKAAREIGALMGQGRREEAEERKHFVADLKGEICPPAGRVERRAAGAANGPGLAAELPGRDRPRRQNGGRQPGGETRGELHCPARKPAAPLGTGQEVRHHRLRPRREAHRSRIPPSTRARAPGCSAR